MSNEPHGSLDANYSSADSDERNGADTASRLPPPTPRNDLRTLDYMPEEHKESVAGAVVKRIVAAAFCGCFAWMAIGMFHERSSSYYAPALAAAAGAILCFLVAIGTIR